MRDILVSLIVFASLPYILRSPVNGVMMWVWISVMNPHTQGWGFATSFPFAAIVAGTTIVSMLMSREPKAVPWTPVTLTLLLFAAWMNVTLPFSLHFDLSVPLWARVMKILLMTFVVVMLVKTREHIERLVWVLALSLGFYGFKGGIFPVNPRYPEIAGLVCYPNWTALKAPCDVAIVDSSTPGSVGWMRSAMVKMPSSARSS